MNTCAFWRIYYTHIDSGCRVKWWIETLLYLISKEVKIIPRCAGSTSKYLYIAHSAHSYQHGMRVWPGVHGGPGRRCCERSPADAPSCPPACAGGSSSSCRRPSWSAPTGSCCHLGCSNKHTRRDGVRPKTRDKPESTKISETFINILVWVQYDVCQ